VSFRIVNGEDQPLEEGQIGRLQVAGAPVTMGYYKNPELNRECFSQDSWFNTGDLAMLNNGRLTITGRSKDMVIINGANFFSHEIESVAEEVPGVDVSYTAAFGTRSQRQYRSPLDHVPSAGARLGATTRAYQENPRGAGEESRCESGLGHSR